MFSTIQIQKSYFSVKYYDMKIINWRCCSASKSLLFRYCSTSTHSVPQTKSCNRVRVRFAPSPTGQLHLGGLRTAIYNYLFAKAHKGQFILRIEDTDQSRLVPGAAERLETILKWSGIHPDESPLVGGEYGPYFQSHRLNIYSKFASDLIDKGHAYRCFCTEKRLELLKREATRTRQPNKYDRKCLQLSSSEIEEKLAQKVPHTVRFLLTPDTIPFEDLIFGHFSHNVFENEGDPIIMKSDGYPTYHFANVVDDHLMKITHVLRGVEWQVSTPKHLQMYKAFGWDPPIFGHLPLIMNRDGTKLSKRQSDLHLETLKTAGYYPDAVINFVTSVGGGFEERDYNLDQIHSLDQLISKFDINKVHTASCKIEMDRLDIINRFVIKDLLIHKDTKCKIIRLCRKVITQKVLNLGLQIDSIEDGTIEKYLVWGQDRITKLEDIVGDDLMFLWVQPSKDNMIISIEDSTFERALQIISKSEERKLMKNLKTLSKEAGVQFPVLMKEIRMLITGRAEGPPITELINILGTEVVIKRLKNYLI